MNALHLVMIVDLIIVALLIFCQFEMKRDCLFHYSALETNSMVVQTVPLMIHRQQPMCVSRTELNVDRLLLFRDGMLIVVVLSIAGVSGQFGELRSPSPLEELLLLAFELLDNVLEYAKGRSTILARAMKTIFKSNGRKFTQPCTAS